MLNFGVVPTRQLKAQGMSRLAIRAAMATGELTRVRRGWYARPAASLEAISAIQAGGRVGCVTGCRLHGLWSLPGDDVHVIVGAGCGQAPQTGIQFHPIAGPQFKQAVFPLLDCLAHVVHRHGVETVLVLLEDAVNKELVSRHTARKLLAAAPERTRAAARYFMPNSQSGSETRVRLFFQSRRVGVRPQVRIGGIGTVDLLVGKSLIIECDSQAHHTGEQHIDDLRRDLRARELGYDVLRLSHRQVWDTWEHTRRVLGGHIRRGDHIRLPRRIPEPA